MASRLYRHYKKIALSGQINLLTDNIYCMLVTGYDGGTDTNSRNDTVTGSIGVGKEVVGTAYVRGGALLTSKTLGVGSPAQTDEAYFDAADTSWASSTITATGAIIWKSGSAASSDAALIAWIDFGANQTSTNGLFQIQWNSEGIINLN